MATPVALQLYTVREAIATDRGAAIARAADVGFRAVEAFGIGGAKQPEERLADARELRAQLDEYGMQVVAVHGEVAADESADSVYDELEVLGTDRLIAAVPGLVAGCDNESLGTRDGVKRLADGLNAAAERASTRGVRIGYHNHDWEWKALEDGTPAYDALVSELEPRVFLELDLYWAYVGGQDPAQVVRSYVDRVQLVHVKDGPGVRGELQTSIGAGVVDNVSAIDAATNVAWHVAELDDTAGDPFEVAAAGASWLVEQGRSRWTP